MFQFIRISNSVLIFFVLPKTHNFYEVKKKKKKKLMIANDPVVCAVIYSHFQQCCVGKTKCLTKKSLNKKLFTFRRQHPTHKCFHIFPLMTTSSTMIFLFTPHLPCDHQHSCDQYKNCCRVHMTLTILLNEKFILSRSQ